MHNVTEKFSGTKVLIWGYGREGKSTEKFLKNCCSNVTIDIFEGRKENVRDAEYDWIFVSPGIKFEEADPKFTSQTQVFLEQFRDQTVGVTGTKGKSTTCSLMYAALAGASGRRTFLMGNIGLPCLDYYAQMDENSIAVFELSCHQCQRLTVSPHIAVFLDLYEDHLDRYITMDKYFAAKCGITRNQTAEDFLYLGKQVPPIETKAGKVFIGEEDTGNYELKIPGHHNQYNSEFVCRIAKECFGCDEKKVREALSEFTGLPHRLQLLGTADGITYYDDSISTIPEAVLRAAGSIDHVQTMLIGGMDRNIDYDLLIDFMKKRSDIQFICAYASGQRIYKEVADLPNTYYCEDLAASVDLAKKITKKGRACVLSPAAASYGYFKNFEDRGDCFRRMVLG